MTAPPESAMAVEADFADFVDFDDQPGEPAGQGHAPPPFALAGQGPLEVSASEPAEIPEELAEPGRVLAALSLTPPAVGPGERLIRFAYRAGVPGEALRSPFRKLARPRLLATVDNPLPGDRAAGVALRAGHFLLHGARLAIDELDFTGQRLPPPTVPLVHGFGWLADLAASAPREICGPVAERIFVAWRDAAGRPGKGPAWNVGYTGHRLLAWLIHGPLLLSGQDREFRAGVLATFLETARWLDRHVAKAEDELAEVAGWCAIVAAGLLLPHGKPRRLYGEQGLIRALGELVGDDGGVLSRSPLAQVEAIELLVRLVACYRAVRRDPPEAVTAVLALMMPPLLALVHGDGGLASWQGAGAVDGGRITALTVATGVRARPLRDARQWGYQRVSAGRSLLIVDAAPPPVTRHARDGCASTLAFELSHGEQRIVVNCGGAACAGGLVPLRLAPGLRATAAHSTLVLDDSNSTAVKINGRLGAGVSAVEVERRTIPVDGGDATRIEASHDGYGDRFGFTHRRALVLREDGTVLLGEDRLVPIGRRGRRANVPFAIRFHLGPGVDPYPLDERGAVALPLASGGRWRFRSSDADLMIDDSLWVDGQNRPLATRQLVLHGVLARGGGTFSWVFEKLE